MAPARFFISKYRYFRTKPKGNPRGININPSMSIILPRYIYASIRMENTIVDIGAISEKPPKVIIEIRRVALIANMELINPLFRNPIKAQSFVLLESFSVLFIETITPSVAKADSQSATS